MGIISDMLGQYAGEYGIELPAGALERFELYAKMLLEWNEKINLTAITLPEEIAVKHFLDSLLLLKAVDIPENSAIIDVGTGAGFPGVPLKIARPDLRLTLLDSLNKRVTFLSELSSALGQDNRVIHGRAEQCGREDGLRENFYLATARGVAALPALGEYCLPFVAPGGVFAAMKGPDVEPEAEAAQNAFSLLSAEIIEIKRFILPEDQRRTVVQVKKISQLSPKYPRTAVKITKTPL